MGKGDVMKGVANCAGGTVHEQGVPPRLKDMYKAMEENSVGVPIIDRQTTQIINDVAGLNEYSSDPWMFPLLSENLGKFPPTYLVACGADPLRDDNIIFASELQRLGVRTKIDVYDGMPHLFWTFARFPPFQVFLSNLVGGIQFILSD
ncbi:Alpha/beta hydrolase fold-3 [Neofusicoccum parvum]|uniref:Alpha/beta hydrolase fold-3 n=1 Tax=Neofusicoccum parvum TaxID=310453 RepID=A0ACB5S9D8_9PEZI|nr:Alpha/beta hydrolase fold-3 [Neofusicoccum parvum]